MGNLIWTSGGAGKLIRGSKAASCMRFQINWGATASIYQVGIKRTRLNTRNQSKEEMFNQIKRYSQEMLGIHILRLICFL